MEADSSGTESPSKMVRTPPAPLPPRPADVSPTAPSLHPPPTSIHRRASSRESGRHTRTRRVGWRLCATRGCWTRPRNARLTPSPGPQRSCSACPSASSRSSTKRGSGSSRATGSTSARRRETPHSAHTPSYRALPTSLSSATLVPTDALRETRSSPASRLFGAHSVPTREQLSRQLLDCSSSDTRGLLSHPPSARSPTTALPSSDCKTATCPRSRQLLCGCSSRLPWREAGDTVHNRHGAAPRRHDARRGGVADDGTRSLSHAPAVPLALSFIPHVTSPVNKPSHSPRTAL